MTKNEMIGTILLMVNGGRSTADSSVREWDVRTLIAPAVNMAIEQGDNMNREEDKGRDYLSQFYATYNDVEIDRTGKIPFIELPEGTVPLKGNNGMRAVYDNCGNFYGKLNDSDRATVNYYSCKTPGMYWYYRIGNKLLLYGVGPLVEKINYDALTDINDLDDDAELPMVAGTEQTALSFLYQMVTGQIQNPYDKKIDHDDINKDRS